MRTLLTCHKLFYYHFLCINTSKHNLRINLGIQIIYFIVVSVSIERNSHPHSPHKTLCIHVHINYKPYHIYHYIYLKKLQLYVRPIKIISYNWSRNSFIKSISILSQDIICKECPKKHNRRLEINNTE